MRLSLSQRGWPSLLHKEIAFVSEGDHPCLRDTSFFPVPERNCICLRRRLPLSRGDIVLVAEKGLPLSQKSLRCAPGRQSPLSHRETACLSGTNRFSLFPREIAFFLQGNCWRLGETMSEQDFFCLREKSLFCFRTNSLCLTRTLLLPWENIVCVSE